MAEEKTPKTKKASGDGPAKKPAASKSPAKKPAASGAQKKSAPSRAKAAAGTGAATTPEERAAAERARAREARRSGQAEGRPVRAVAKYLRFSARKGRLVVDQIRGRTVMDAATELTFSKRAAAREVYKVLKSAVSNAEANHDLNAEDLYVQFAYVDEGPTFKRWKPRARGRADRINKRTCHVTVVVNTAPAELLEKQEKRHGDRSARVAASRGKAAQAAGGEPTSKKAKAGAAEGASGKKSGATAKAGATGAAKDAEATSTAKPIEREDTAADATATDAATTDATTSDVTTSDATTNDATTSEEPTAEAAAPEVAATDEPETGAAEADASGEEADEAAPDDEGPAVADATEENDN